MTMVERTGFSAEQGSMISSSLDISDSSLVRSPPAKTQKVAMCVIPGASTSAGINAQRDLSVEDDSVSCVSGSTNSQILAMEAAIERKKVFIKCIFPMLKKVQS